MKGGMTLPELIIGEPNEKQKSFLLDKHRRVGYGGA